MNDNDIIIKGYKELFGNEEIRIFPMPKSGSDRKYFRVTSERRSVICTLNPVVEENHAFISFSKHFFSKGLPVPEILGYIEDLNIYFQSDLGDLNLFTFLKELPEAERFSESTIRIYQEVLDNLVLFQTKGIEGLDLNLCYPHRSFDRQSMMWDMNYFKYMFLKLLAVPFNERKLEHDFTLFADYLLEAGDKYFLYRDFQSANIMIKARKPFFIDFQGGRKGAPQYDIASLLYDAKVPMPEKFRNELFAYFCDRFCSSTSSDKDKFRFYFYGFAMIRLMQAMGTFGFRGLYENKPTFTDSMVPGLVLLISVVDKAEGYLRLPELYQAVRKAKETEKYKELAASI